MNTRPLTMDERRATALRLAQDLRRIQATLDASGLALVVEPQKGRAWVCLEDGRALYGTDLEVCGVPGMKEEE